MFKHKQRNNSTPLHVYLYSTARIPLQNGEFDIRIYRSNQDASETVVISQGEIQGQRNLFVRIHSECFTGEVLGSSKCDCGFQLQNALDHIAQAGKGAVIYLRQEGRGIGLGNKIRAYDLQNQGLDTIEANHALGLETDLRDFSLAAHILLHLGIDEVLLNTNNEDKCAALRAAGIAVTSLIPSLPPLNDYNYRYLETKFRKMGHKLEELFN